MKNLINETGNRYLRLRVVSRAPNKSGATRWNCVCDCGNKVQVYGASLRRGLTKSCGCYSREIAVEKARRLGRRNKLSPEESWRRLHADKPCIVCSAIKPPSGFRGLRLVCNSCLYAKSQSKKKKFNKRYFRSKYGITEERYEEMLQKQSGKCSICGCTPLKFHLDHDHRTGKIRALLCNGCNMMLGGGRDDVNILLKGAEYIKRHSS